MNVLIVVGNLTRDPDHRITPSGVSIVSGSIAVNKKVKSEQHTTFIDYKAFKGTADIMRDHLQKGSKVLLQGELQMDKWQDRTSGENRSKLVMYVEKLTFLDSKAEQKPEQAAPKQTELPREGTTFDNYDPEDEVPF